MFSFLPFFFYALPLSSSSMAKPPASLPSFSRYAKISSPFLQLAMCPFSESSKNQRSKKTRFRTRRPILVSPFPFFFYFYFLLPLPFFFFELSLFPLFFCKLLTQMLGILSLWFLRGLWDSFRLLIIKQPKRLKILQLLQVGIQ